MTAVHDAGTINVNISDHLPIYIVKKKCRMHREYCEIMGRAYRNLDLDSFNEDLLNIDEDYLFSEENPNIIW